MTIQIDKLRAILTTDGSTRIVPAPSERINNVLLNGFSMEIWCRWHGQGDEVLFTLSNISRTYQLRINRKYNLMFTVRSSFNNEVIEQVDFQVQLPAEEWANIALTAEKRKLALYGNGQLLASNRMQEQLIRMEDDVHWQLFATGTSQGFIGDVASVVLYEGARSEVETKENFLTLPDETHPQLIQAYSIKGKVLNPVIAATVPAQIVGNASWGKVDSSITTAAVASLEANQATELSAATEMSKVNLKVEQMRHQVMQQASATAHERLKRAEELKVETILEAQRQAVARINQANFDYIGYISGGSIKRYRQSGITEEAYLYTPTFGTGANLKFEDVLPIEGTTRVVCVQRDQLQIFVFDLHAPEKPIAYWNLRNHVDMQSQQNLPKFLQDVHSVEYIAIDAADAIEDIVKNFANEIEDALKSISNINFGSFGNIVKSTSPTTKSAPKPTLNQTHLQHVLLTPDGKQLYVVIDGELFVYNLGDFKYDSPQDRRNGKLSSRYKPEWRFKSNAVYKIWHDYYPELTAENSGYQYIPTTARVVHPYVHGDTVALICHGGTWKANHDVGYNLVFLSRSGKLQSAYPSSLQSGMTNLEPSSLSSDLTQIASNRGIELLDGYTGTSLTDALKNKQAVFSPSNQWVATPDVSGNNTHTLYDLITNTHVMRWKASQNKTSIFTRDSRYFITERHRDNSRYVDIFDLARGTDKALYYYQLDGFDVVDICLSPDEQFIAIRDTASILVYPMFDNNIKLNIPIAVGINEWNITNFVRASADPAGNPHHDTKGFMKFSGDGEYLIASDQNNNTQIFPLPISPYWTDIAHDVIDNTLYLARNDHHRSIVSIEKLKSGTKVRYLYKRKNHINTLTVDNAVFEDRYRYIYWIENEGEIWRGIADGSSANLLYEGVPQGRPGHWQIVVDSVREFLYWTNGREIWQGKLVQDRLLQVKVVVSNAQSPYPIDLAIDDKKGWLFWQDRDVEMIRRYQPEQKNDTHPIDDMYPAPIVRPGLALDSAVRHLYWNSYRERLIEAAIIDDPGLFFSFLDTGIPSLTDHQHVPVIQDWARYGANWTKITANNNPLKNRNSLQFDGTGAFASIGSLYLDFSQGFTFEAYVKAEHFRDYPRLLELSNGMFKDMISIFIDNKGQLGMHVSHEAGEDYRHRTDSSQANGKLTARKWYYIAYTIDKVGFWNVYIDGQASPWLNGASVARPRNGLRTQCIVGKHSSNNNPFTGNIGFMRLWNIALSPHQIAEHANQIAQDFKPQAGAYSRSLVEFRDGPFLMRGHLDWGSISGVYPDAEAIIELEAEGGLIIQSHYLKQRMDDVAKQRELERKLSEANGLRIEKYQELIQQRKQAAAKIAQAKQMRAEKVAAARNQQEELRAQGESELQKAQLEQNTKLNTARTKQSTERLRDEQKLSKGETDSYNKKQSADSEAATIKSDANTTANQIESSARTKLRDVKQERSKL